MKRPFRYFRGEFANGKYLYSLVICPNLVVQDILDELVYQTLFQWKLEDEITLGEMAIRDEDIVNIAKIAGLFQLRSYGRTSIGSTYFTPSHIVNGKERSERGLMDMEAEGFKFVRVEQDDYDDDIVNEASSKMRMGLVPEGTKPVGYVPYDRKLFTDEGEVIWENVLPAPPTDGTPYVTYYGDRFLIHEEFFNRETPLPIYVLKLLLECVQQIRHNGPSVARFLEITKILGDGYICDIEIESHVTYYMVFYRINESADTAYRDRRYAAWLHICQQKFKLFVLENRDRA
jgi:hypothetical protein